MPEGGGAGARSYVRLADGCVITVEVPAGAKPGQTSYDLRAARRRAEARVAAEDAERKAAARGARRGARARDRQARLEKAAADAKKRAADDAKQKKAATLLQARHRGAAARRRGAKLAAAKRGEAARKAAPSVDLTAGRNVLCRDTVLKIHSTWGRALRRMRTRPRGALPSVGRDHFARGRRGGGAV